MAEELVEPLVKEKRKKKVKGRESEKSWEENGSFARWEGAREWNGNEEEIAVFSAGGTEGSFTPYPSAHDHDELLFVLSLPAFSFINPPLPTQYLFINMLMPHTLHMMHWLYDMSASIIMIKLYYISELRILIMMMLLFHVQSC